MSPFLTAAVLLALASDTLLVSGIDRSKALGPCVRGGLCPPNSFCVENECYNSSAIEGGSRLLMRSPPATAAGASIGTCINGKCPYSYDCINNECMPGKKHRSIGTNGEPIGPCINNLCPAGYTCKVEEYKCYASQ